MPIILRVAMLGQCYSLRTKPHHSQLSSRPVHINCSDSKFASHWKMGFNNFFFGSSSTPVNQVSDKSSISSSSSRVDSLLPPIPSTDSSLLTPATSADIGMTSSLSKKKADLTVVDAEKGPPSYKSWSGPPVVKQPYNPTYALLDLPPICYALDLFLQSKMLESEEFCDKNDAKKERLYFATGYGLIQCVKALMSYEDDVSFLSCTHTGCLFRILIFTILHVGSAGRNRAYKTWKSYRQFASEEASISWFHHSRICRFVTSYIWRWLHQEHDRCRTSC